MSKEDKARKVVNMNYPPADMPLEEIQRFWGEPSKGDAIVFRDIKVDEKARKNVKPSPL